jgi:Chalcone isomerase-like
MAGGLREVTRSSTRAILLCIAMLAPPSVAASLEGQRFDEGAKLATQDLTLNGLGLRSILFIKVYVAGLYLPEKATTLRVISQMPGPKRLQLRMLRKAGPDDFIEALVEGIEDNSSKAELAQLNARMRQLTQTIHAIGSVVAGDSINFDFVPGLGTSLAINGVTKGDVIEGADFYNAVLKIFVGENPVDERLKAGLLGK